MCFDLLGELTKKVNLLGKLLGELLSSIYMQISIKIVLDKRFLRKNNTFSIVIRIIKDRRPALIRTGFEVSQDNFIEMEDGEAIVTKDPAIKNISRINKSLKDQLADVREFINGLIDSGVINSMSSTEIRHAYVNRNKSNSLNQFMKNRASDLQESGRSGYGKLWEHAESFLTRALGKDIAFEDFNLKTIHKLERFHLSNNPDGINGLSAYLRLVRTAYYRFAKENNIDMKNNPWISYTIRSKRTRKRATTSEIIKKFRDFDVPRGMKLDAKNLYMLSFYLAGINLIDLAKLKVMQIYDGKIHYSRTKIHEEISIPIPPQAQEIIDFYISGKRPEDFVFPIFDPNRNKAENDTLYRSRRNTYNDYIDAIFKEIGVMSDKKITFYSARHTWASRANELNKPISAISQGLGHTDIKTTQIYLDELKDNVLDEVNRDVIELD